MADLNLSDFVGRQLVAAAHAAEARRAISAVGVVLGVERLEAVVGKPAAGRVEEIVPLAQGLEKAVEVVADVDAGSPRPAGRPRR